MFNLRFRYYYLRLLQEVFPAFILDCYMRIIGRKPIFSKLSDKIYKSVRTLDFFTSHSWVFPNDNSIALQNEMNDIDQKIFGFDLKELNWAHYWYNYCLGAKQYLLREDLARTSKCHTRYLRLKRLQNILYFTAIAVVVKLVFLKSFQFRRIFIVLFRLILSAISGITAKIGFRTK
jgi:fatty acyl-CoA reductase